MLEADVDDYEIATMDLAVRKSLAADDAPNWPPLRLAIVSDSASTPPDRATSPAGATMSPTAWHAPQFEQVDDSSWSRGDSSHSGGAADQLPADDEEPVLIVEDDNPAPHSPVRREEYRNLFSRLRSG